MLQPGAPEFVPGQKSGTEDKGAARRPGAPEFIPRTPSTPSFQGVQEASLKAGRLSARVNLEFAVKSVPGLQDCDLQVYGSTESGLGLVGADPAGQATE